ncbi:MAG: hypothetical protein ACKOEW_06300 [Methylocystis sp.]
MLPLLITLLLVLTVATLPAAAASIDDSLSGVIDTDMKENAAQTPNKSSKKEAPDKKQKPKIWDMDGPSLETDGINGR